MNLKIKITLENKRLLRLRRCVKTKIWCEECLAETDFVWEKEIIQILERISEPGKLHKAQTDEGTTLICLESLLNH